MTTAVLSRNDTAYSGRPSSHEQANKPFYATWPCATPKYYYANYLLHNLINSVLEPRLENRF